MLQPSTHHLAQLNVGRALDDMDSSRLKEFMENLDRINALAERMPGFVWRFTGDGSNNATDVKIDGDPRFILNMSVWATAEALENFVWNTVHKRFYAKKANWFEAMAKPHFVMWWVPEGHIPTVDEALERLGHFTEHGPSLRAFGWESMANAKVIAAQRCA